MSTWNAVIHSGNPTFMGPTSFVLNNGDEIRSFPTYDIKFTALLIDIPLPILNNPDDAVFVGGHRYFGHCTYPNLITFKYNSQVIGAPQTYSPGDRFRIYFDGVNVSFSLNNYGIQTPISFDYNNQNMRISVSSSQQNSYTFNNVNVSATTLSPQHPQAPVYASTIYENVTLNNSDYNSFLGNHAVPKGYVDQKVADLVNGAPAALDTLKELSDALNGDANLATSLINLVSEEKSRAQAAEASIQSSLSTKTTSLESVTASLSADIIAESARAQAAESKVAADLATETARAQTADSKIASDLTAESVRAQAAETKVATDLAAEAVRSQAADAKVASDLTAESVRAQAAEAKVASDLTAEVVRAQAAETKVSTELAAEVVRAQAAESKVSSDLATESARAQVAETKVASDLSAETVRAQAAESKLGTDIDDMKTWTGQEDNRLMNYVLSELNTEVSRAQAAEVVLNRDLVGEMNRALLAENTKVNLSGPNTLTGANTFTGPLILNAGMKVTLNGSSFLYIGANWRINAGNNGKTLLFEYNQNPYLGGSWVTAVPFIQTM